MATNDRKTELVPLPSHAFPLRVTCTYDGGTQIQSGKLPGDNFNFSPLSSH